MSQNRGFWSRLISPFRRSTNQRQSRSNEFVNRNEDVFTLSSSDSNFQVCERPFRDSSSFQFRFNQPKDQSKSDSYIPKSLGNVDTSSILFGAVRPESFSRGCWLENHLSRFGGLRAGATFSSSYDLEDTFSSVQSETDADFVFRRNLDDSDDVLFLDDTDSMDDYVSGGLNSFDVSGVDELSDSDLDVSFRIHRGVFLDSTTGHDEVDDDATLRGSTGSLESTISEVLGMLDDVLAGQTSETPSPIRPIPSSQQLQPPPYSAVDAMTPLEPPPSYSDLFGTGVNQEMNEWCL